jgi:predicted peptidase
MVEHLSEEEIRALLAEMDPTRPIEVTRIRYKNRQEIRRSTPMSVAEFRDFILGSYENGHQPGGDLEAPLDCRRILVGHHDGIYWIEELKGNPEDGTTA